MEVAVLRNEGTFTHLVHNPSVQSNLIITRKKGQRGVVSLHAIVTRHTCDNKTLVINERGIDYWLLNYGLQGIVLLTDQ